MKILWALIVLAGLALEIGYLPRALLARNLSTLKYLTIVIMSQNMLAALSNLVFPSFLSQVIILFKEVILYGVVVLSLLFDDKPVPTAMARCNMVLIGLFIIYFFVGEASLYTKLVCFRQIMTPVILLLYGRSLWLTRADVKEYCKFLVSLCVFQALFGLMERFVFQDEFWRTINVASLMESKGMGAWVFDNGLPGNYYSADFYDLLGINIRRLVGFTTDPLLTAHFIAFGAVIVLYDYSFKKLGLLILMGIAILLTISKGAILVVGFVVWYWIWRRSKTAALILLIPVVAVLGYVISRNTLGSVAIHFSGFLSGFNSNSLLGSGLGTVGNYATLSGSNINATGESFVAALMGQMGIPGIVGFFCLFICYLKEMKKHNPGEQAYAVFSYIVAVFLESLMSESAINYVGSGIAFIVLGLLSQPLPDPNPESYEKSIHLPQ